MIQKCPKNAIWFRRVNCWNALIKLNLEGKARWKMQSANYANQVLLKTSFNKKKRKRAANYVNQVSQMLTLALISLKLLRWSCDDS